MRERERNRVLAGVSVLPSHCHSQFLSPVRVLQIERVEGGNGGGKLSATSTQDWYQVTCHPRRLLDDMLQLIATPLRELIVLRDHRHHFVCRAE